MNYTDPVPSLGRRRLIGAAGAAALAAGLTAPHAHAAAAGRDVTKIFADIDSFDPDKFVAHLTDDVVFRFANNP
ncbi:hypothetical protein H9Y04_43815 [Streptomyces sp. TRM66268-LWL]|uniref:Uncharacterized protein n=1 Tax=Streptomyces polyasparticus TaxID=2767826 RepID=A0ABR7SY24_9ACTN|nr:hypothetical protein [Streptomyces polyasparticus]MBC9719456.1 hypothetical protein [Streptomyces polyasparticus]